MEEELSKELIKIFKQAVKEAEDTVKRYGLNLPQKPSEDFYKEISSFPEDVTSITDSDLMALWNKASRLEEYAEFLFTRESLLCKYLEMAKERAYIDAKMNADSSRKWEKEDLAILDEKYTALDMLLLKHISIRDLLNQSLKLYRKYTAFCSRDLTRRMGTIENKNTKDGFHRYVV